jgi:hypothetical protein
MLSSDPDTGLTGADKAKFVKAMLEGISGKSLDELIDRPADFEVLHKIPARITPSKTSTPESDEALKLTAALEAKLLAGETDALTPQAMQALMMVLCKIYAGQVEADSAPPILQSRHAVAATDVMLVCGALLEAVGLQVFELGMWQSWSDR